MTASDTYDRLPDAVTDVFGTDATAAHAYDLLTVDVPAASWIGALETARDELGCTYFDWLSAVDEPGTGFRVCAHVAALGDGTVRRLLLRTTVPHEAAVLPTAVGVYAGAAWHERETHEMFGIDFSDHPHLVPLLLPESFEGHPLRKDFVLAARVAKAWPGAKEPGESEHGGPKRRTMLPPGVPDPNEWGPLKGQLPPAPARPARGARAAGDRPVRRARSASEGSAAQRPDATETPQAAPPRRTRSASQGSASQATGPAPESPAATPPSPGGPGDGATDMPDAATPDAATPDAATTDARTSQGGGAARAKGAAGSADAPWHDAQPAFGDTPKEPGPERPVPDGPVPDGHAPAEPERAAAPEPEQPSVSGPEQPSEAEADSDSADSASDSAPDSSDDTDPGSPSPTDGSAGPDRPAGGDTA
ncbi:NADH-quinone oxidoreductase subunit C [Streptomyces sp. wa22]|uniref:NADH-quinone oxidoreductase subunit C n=1 Tax=Streptomyces sp. wa22 TaxID=1828244 RepID=UPI0011CC4B2A|nr:NADH-quinone oxidoreductase subunit C [Streptomyces sp. wa22]TXS17503.1 NADH-quinone oxidoreductase subunit C [Streptomyces sp. wa22]